MAANPSAVVITAGTDTYTFAIAPTEEGGAQLEIETRPWEPGDPKMRWYARLHPCDGGLVQDRTEYTRGYAKANADASWDGLLTFPPKLNLLTLANGDNPHKIISRFDNLAFIIGGRYIYTYDRLTDTAAQDKDLGSGKAATDAAVFEGELVVAMGETEKIWTRATNDTYTQATDNVYATHLAVIGSRLFRSESGNKISSSVTAPRTLANWIPASPNQTPVGDDTWDINCIIDYGGVAWVGKGDGMYAPDSTGRYFNQTPQLARAPHPDNCKGAFVAQGYLWVPSSTGLIRIRQGQSKIMGPEVTQRRDFRFWVRGGTELGDAIYLLCTDEAGSSNTVVVKMVRDIHSRAKSGQEYIYHEWARLPGATKGYAIAGCACSTDPRMVVAYGDNIYYIVTGRGGGRDIDDSNYDFGTAMELETGRFAPGATPAVTSTLVGVSVLCDFSRAGESLVVSAAFDTDSYVELLSTYEGGGVDDIRLTDGWENVTRYAPPGTEGQYLNVKFTGALTSASGTAHPEIREAFAFGYSRPKVTDAVTVALVGDGRARTESGTPSGISSSQALDMFRQWMTKLTPLEVAIDGYETRRTTRFLVTDVETTTPVRSIGNAGRTESRRMLRVEFTRVDYAGEYAR
jgi:hypothetical protein